MKKLFVVSVLFIMCLSGTVFAANELDGVGDLVNLSNQVVGDYYVDATPATAFSMSTGHQQGNNVYATGSFTTDIYRAAIAGDSFVAATDLLGDPTTYNSSTLDTFGSPM